VNGEQLGAGDAAYVLDGGQLYVRADETSELILVDVPAMGRTEPALRRDGVDDRHGRCSGNRRNRRSKADAGVDDVHSDGSRPRRAIGGFGANQHLRQSLVFLNVPTLQQPEAYIGQGGALVDADGTLTDDSTAAFLRTFMEAFGAWIETVAPSEPTVLGHQRSRSNDVARSSA
jgi:chromate reductase